MQGQGHPLWLSIFRPSFSAPFVGGGGMCKTCGWNVQNLRLECANPAVVIYREIPYRERYKGKPPKAGASFNASLLATMIISRPPGGTFPVCRPSSFRRPHAGSYSRSSCLRPHGSPEATAFWAQSGAMWRLPSGSVLQAASPKPLDNALKADRNDTANDSQRVPRRAPTSRTYRGKQNGDLLANPTDTSTVHS